MGDATEVTTAEEKLVPSHALFAEGSPVSVDSSKQTASSNNVKISLAVPQSNRWPKFFRLVAEKKNLLRNIITKTVLRNVLWA